MSRLWLFCFIAPLIGCVGAQQKPGPVHLCIISISDKMCWLDKKTNSGLSLQQIDGFFAEGPADLESILNRLDDRTGQ